VEEFYVNPLSKRHGLQADDLRQEAKLLRLCEDLQAKILTPVSGVVDWHFSLLELTAQQALAAEWVAWDKFGPRTVWGKKQGHTWFAANVTVDGEAAGKTLVLRFSSQWQDRLGSTDPQCLAYLNGSIVQALDGNHTELVISRDAVPGDRFDLMINAFTFFERPLVGFDVEFLVRDERAEQLYYDLQIPMEVAVRLPQHDERRHAIMGLVNKSLRELDRRGDVGKGFEMSLGAAEKIATQIYALKDTAIKPTISAVGHTHIDVGWLWRVLHTRDKTGRSFATALALMEEYPDFTFMYNQAVLFDFLKQDYPEIWARVKERVASGQFEIEGAMWVEPDVNIISGESIIRQFMRGRQFHIEEFGVTPKVVWLPDTFGYSANLPQIMTRSGLDYFVTSKLSWNDSDRQPFDTFFWRGIDGSTTKAQLITTQDFDSEEIFTTYNSNLSPSEVMGAWKRYEPKALNDEVLICYGHGDGGGGPTRAMIESGKRMARGIPGAPNVKFEGIAPFLERLGKRMDANADRFPIWDGELYLQYHRGTLTSVARNKANNRRAEREMKELEYLCAMATVLSPDVPYPSAKIAEFWDIILINQFHDILPGTSIAEVYKDSDAEYDSLFAALESADGPRKVAAAALSKPNAGQLTLFNFTSQKRDAELVNFVGRARALQVGGDIQIMQKVFGADGTVGSCAPMSRVPPLGWATAQINNVAVPTPQTKLSVSTSHLENDFLRVTFDKAGEITSVIDKLHERELIAPGKTANALIAYEDKPRHWDAWDIDRSFDEQFWPLANEPKNIEVLETGPYRAAIRIERAYASSKIVQVISLQDGARQVEFDTHIDWQERQTLLKTLFPLDLNTSEIRSEVQFGHVVRATHRNTSWDQARYEASMHRWVDMSEPDFGAALLNNCKYGYDAVGQIVRLTLLKSPVDPYPDADLGEHRMRYALKLHDGLFDLAQVVLAAERFNNPISVIGETRQMADETDHEPASFSFANVDRDNVTLETLKKAQDGDDLILRVFEHANKRTSATIEFGIPIAKVQKVNLMEEGGEPVAVIDNSVTLDLRPFEISTLRITPV
jgi:alpha-mannosidase